jgi:thioredoxin-related protein
VDLDSFGTKRVVKFVKGLDFQVTYPIVVDKRREVAARYGVSVLPTTIVIDRRGKVVYYHVGYAPGDEVEIEEVVKQALTSGP